MSAESSADLRGDLERIFRAGLERADPLPLIASRLRLEGEDLVLDLEDTSTRLDLGRFDNVILIGAGKASARMAAAVEGVLGDRISGGVVVVKYGHGETLRKTRIMEAGHPVPDAAGVAASTEVERRVRQAGERTLVIGLFSGGGSALLCSPCAGISLSDKQSTTASLLACGATIDEINCVRKHLSALKGGRLAELTYPATSLNLFLSDVVGDDLSTISSGPTVPDASTYSDALGILRSHSIIAGVPPAVRDLLERGARGEIEETPPPESRCFARCRNVLVGTNRHSVYAAAQRARELGYTALALTSQAHGEARELGRVLAGLARDCAEHGLPIPAPACIVVGGETTVTLRGGGKGGRNQEMALAFLDDFRIAGIDPRIALLAASTDGTDGPTDAAGAYADAEVLDKSRRLGLDSGSCLADNDSYSFFDATGGLLRTGPTRTNVCDLQIILVGTGSQSVE